MEEDRRRRIVEARERRGVAAGAGTKPKARRRKYVAVKPPAGEHGPGEGEEGPQTGTVMSLAELLAMEDGDHIDADEETALNAALATRDVAAVLAFSTTLMTPQAPGTTTKGSGGALAHRPDQPVLDEEAQHAACLLYTSPSPRDS